MQEEIEEILASHGYEHYETSAFAKPSLHHKNSQARHNQNYWQFGDYLGIGAGAHSKLSYHDKITREMRHKHPNRYLEAAQTAQPEQNCYIDNAYNIPQAELGFEFMMNTLRLIDGFEVSLFQARTGLSIEVIAKPLKQARDKGLLEITATKIKPTLLGQRFLNELLQLFL